MYYLGYDKVDLIVIKSPLYFLNCMIWLDNCLQLETEEGEIFLVRVSLFEITGRSGTFDLGLCILGSR